MTRARTLALTRTRTRTLTRTHPSQATPLHIAAFNGRLEVVKLLCLRGADPHAKDKDGYTPLDDARYRSADRCCAVETAQAQWVRVAAFLDKVGPMAAEVTHAKGVGRG
jgi:hypothetical protein